MEFRSDNKSAVVRAGDAAILRKSQFLNTTADSHIFDLALLSHSFSELLSNDQVFSRTEHIRTKFDKLQKKYVDLVSLLRTQPQHEEARKKLLKCYQRFSAFSTLHADPFAHILHMRTLLLQRALLAHHRTLMAEEMGLDVEFKESKRIVETEADKIAFIQQLFPQDEEDDDQQMETSMTKPDQEGDQKMTDSTATEQQTKIRKSTFKSHNEFGVLLFSLAQTLPNVYGLTGLTGLPLPNAKTSAETDASATPEEDAEAPVKRAGEDDSAFAARVQSYQDKRTAKRKKAALEKMEIERQAREQRRLDRKEKKEQRDLERQSALAEAQLRNASVDEIARINEKFADPDSNLPDDAHYAPVDMTEMLLDDSYNLTLQQLKVFEEDEGVANSWNTFSNFTILWTN